MRSILINLIMDVCDHKSFTIDNINLGLTPADKWFGLKKVLLTELP